MIEKCKVYNLESFTDEELKCVEELINQIEKNKKKKKWWIVPKYNLFSYEESQFGESYIVEEQKDSYSKSRPPLKSDFNSKEEAEVWLNNYLEEESLFKSAKNDIDNLVCNLGHIAEKFQKHECITADDWTKCFELFNESRIYGALFKVTRGLNMDMNVNNWVLKDSCDDTQFYYESKLNNDMIACIVIPHKGNHFKWLLRIGFKSTFNKWGDVEYENTFNTFPLLTEFMSDEKHLKEIELQKEV